MSASTHIRPGEQVVLFSVSRYTYAISIASVREIHPAAAVTRVPDPPPSCEGVINLRGCLVPVFDLRERLGLEKRAAQLADHFVFIQDDDATIAYRVDSVVEVAAVREFLPPSGEHLAGAQLALVGAVKVAGDIVPLVDLARLVDRNVIEALEAGTGALGRSAD